jgi:hypothetical protein
LSSEVVLPLGHSTVYTTIIDDDARDLFFPAIASGRGTAAIASRGTTEHPSRFGLPIIRADHKSFETCPLNEEKRFACRN